MSTHSGKDRDFVTVARRVVEQAIGERLDGTPLEPQGQVKNSVAASSGRLGGLKGGEARAQKLGPEIRSAIAKRAASARWKTSKD
jgi:hypothetical protein